MPLKAGVGTCSGQLLWPRHQPVCGTSSLAGLGLREEGSSWSGHSAAPQISQEWKEPEGDIKGALQVKWKPGHGGWKGREPRESHSEGPDGHHGQGRGLGSEWDL